MGQQEPSTDRRDSKRDWHIQVFYDGDCPLCKREIDQLRRMDRQRKIRFTNIAAEDFNAGDLEVSWDELMSEIHGRLLDGTWVKGVEVFRRLYAAVGWTPVVWLTRLPIIAGLLDRAYRVFARNRLRWTRRCTPDDSSCRVDRHSAEQNLSGQPARVMPCSVQPRMTMQLKNLGRKSRGGRAEIRRQAG